MRDKRAAWEETMERGDKCTQQTMLKEESDEEQMWRTGATKKHTHEVLFFFLLSEGRQMCDITKPETHSGLRNLLAYPHPDYLLFPSPQKYFTPNVIAPFFYSSYPTFYSSLSLPVLYQLLLLSQFTIILLSESRCLYLSSTH